MFKKYVIIALGGLIISGQVVYGAEKFKASESVFGVYRQMLLSENKKSLFTGEELNLGNDLHVSPTVYLDGYYGLGLETRIYGTREELIHPSINVEKNGYVSQNSTNPYDYKHKQATPSMEEIKKGLSLRTDLLLAIEKARRKNQARGSFLSEVRLDSRTKCELPVFYGEGLSHGWIKCKTAYEEKDLDKI